MISRELYSLSQATQNKMCINKKRESNSATQTLSQNNVINQNYKLPNYMAVKHNMLSLKGNTKQNESDKAFIKLLGLGQIEVNVPNGFIKKLIDIGNTDIRIPTGNERLVSHLTDLVIKDINPLEVKMQKLNDKELLGLYKDLKSDIQCREKSSDPKIDKTLEKKALDAVLPVAFALTREVCKRQTGGIRLYDEQLMAAAVMHDGDLCEMGTGEGKTFAIMPAIVLRSLTGKPSYVLTANDYLAEEGAIKTKALYNFFDLNVTNLKSGEPSDIRKEKYKSADIIYTQASEPGFDILRDFSTLTKEDKLNHKPLGFAVVDEADQMMIDEATTPLIRSEEVTGSTNLDQMRYGMAKWVKTLNEYEDYEIDYKEKSVDIFEETIEKAYNSFQQDPKMAKILEKEGGKESNVILNCLNDALRAEKLFIRDKDYIVDKLDGKEQIILISRDTGRIMPSRRFQNGFHSALEAKENLKISPDTMQTAKIIMPELLKHFETYSGTTGTAKCDEPELNMVYDKKVIAVPPHKPCQRIDAPPSIYINKYERFFATINEMVKIHNTGRPVLIGTFSEAESNQLAELLKSPDKVNEYQQKVEKRILEFHSDHPNISNIERAVKKTKTAEELNNWIDKNSTKAGFSPKLATHLKEIVDCRAMTEAVTNGLEINVLNNKNHEKESAVVAKGGQKGAITIANQMAGRGMDIKPSKEVEKLGGLHVIISGMHESERVYRQFEGRAGRQGNPGTTHRISSLGDDLIAGHPEMDMYFNLIKQAQDLSNEPISGSMATQFIDKYRKSINGLQQDIRAQSKKYDEPHAKQMEVVEIFHNKLMNHERYPELVLEMIDQEVDDSANYAFNEKTNAYSPELRKEDIPKLNEAFKNYSKNHNIEKSFKNLPYSQNYISSIIKLYDSLDFVPKEVKKHYSPTNLMNYESMDKLKTSLKTALKSYYQDLRKQVQPNPNDKAAQELFNKFEAKSAVFSLKQEWQSHLQRLDDLKTTCGLHSYAGLDPLNEYKIQAFDLFGGMLHQTQQKVVSNIITAYENRINEDKPVNPYYKG